MKNLTIAVLALFALVLYAPKAALAVGATSKAVVVKANATTGPAAVTPEAWLQLLKDSAAMAAEDPQGCRLAAKIYDGIVSGMGAEAAFGNAWRAHRSIKYDWTPISDRYCVSVGRIKIAQAKFYRHFFVPIHVFLRALINLRGTPAAFQQAHSAEINQAVAQFEERMQPLVDATAYTRLFNANLRAVVRQLASEGADFSNSDDPKVKQLTRRACESAALRTMFQRYQDGH